VYREREKEKGKERKNREEMKFFVIFFPKKTIPAIKKDKKIKICPGIRVTGLGCPVTLVPGFPSKYEAVLTVADVRTNGAGLAVFDLMFISHPLLKNE